MTFIFLSPAYYINKMVMIIIYHVKLGNIKHIYVEQLYDSLNFVQQSVQKKCAGVSSSWNLYEQSWINLLEDWLSYSEVVVGFLVCKRITSIMLLILSAEAVLGVVDVSPEEI